MYKKNGNTNNETENLKRKQKETLELKRITEMKNSLGRFKSRFEHADDRISEPQDRAMESIESKE